ncbi:MAG TPA: endonuclease/exonuclease/phosphatase family protein [Polyangiaceae bacterium]|nr:endonuclease/exonuclease/phosphatase family protein [Polyangiaceae bacterium]
MTKTRFGSLALLGVWTRSGARRVGWKRGARVSRALVWAAASAGFLSSAGWVRAEPERGSVGTEFEDGVKLRVLSFNVWGVPRITPELEGRMRALPGAIAGEGADLVLLQELWEPAHAEAVARALREKGYGYALYWAQPARGETGLFAAAKWPLTPIGFQRYAAGRLPHSFWHLDWLVSKGVASFWLETPLGRVLVENTHLQAQYRTDRYEGERLSQACELVFANRRYADSALILGGDFNSGAAESPRRTLAALGGLVDAYPSAGDDTVYARSGGGLALRVLAGRAVLSEPLRLDNGAVLALSDHRAVRVDFALSRCSSCPRAAPRDSAAQRAAVSDLERAAATTHGRVALSLLAALASAFVAVFWRRQRRRARPTRIGRGVYRLGMAFLMLGFVWSFYLASVYYPLRGHTLHGILRALEREGVTNRG